MPKIAVKDTTLILTSEGSWQWGAGKELEITVRGAKHPLSCSKNPGIMPTDVLEAIQSQVPGQPYRHRETATSPGTVGFVDASVDTGTLAEKLTVGGERVITDATEGTFTIAASIPSWEGQQADPRMRHSGSWKVGRTQQEVLTEREGGGDSDEASPTEASAAATSAAAPAAAAADEADEADAGVAEYRVELELELVDDPLLRIWGPEMLSRGGLALEIGAAQPGSRAKGLAGRFRKSILWKQLCAEGDDGPTLIKAIVTLSPAAIDPSRPLWLAIRGLPFGGRAELRTQAIGQVALFTAAGGQEAIVRPQPLEPGPGFNKPDGHEDMWVTAEKADGKGEEGTATALIRSAPELLDGGDGWATTEKAPGPPANEWTPFHRPIKYRLALDRDPKGESPPRLEPLRVELSPLRPGLLAANSLARRLGLQLECLADLLEKSVPAITLATTLENLCAVQGAIGDAVAEGMTKRSPPRAIAEDADRSHGLVDPTLGNTLPAVPVTPARLFLMRRIASLRKLSFALRDTAEPLFQLLDDQLDDRGTCVPVDLAAEQRRARLFLGALALERGGDRTGEAEWAISVARALAPDWDVVGRMTVLAGRCLHTLSQADAQFKMVSTLGAGFSRDGGERLLDDGTGDRWRRIVGARIARDEFSMLEEFFEKQETLPALHQLAEVMRRAGTPARLLKGLCDAYLEWAKVAQMRIVETFEYTEVVIDFALRKTWFRKALIQTIKTRKKLRVSVWVMEGRARLERISLDMVDGESVRKMSDAHLRRILDRRSANRAEAIVGKIGKGLQGFLVLVCVIDILDKLTQGGALEKVDGQMELAVNVLILAGIGLTRFRGVPKARLGGLISVVECAIALIRAHDAWVDKNYTDATREALSGICLLMMSPKLLAFIGITGNVPVALIIIGAVLVMAALQFVLRSKPSGDITDCARSLTGLVSASVFGKKGFEELGNARPRIAETWNPSSLEAERDWLDDVEKYGEQQGFAATIEPITLAASAVALEFEPASLELKFCPAIGYDWTGWFGEAGKASGYRLKIPGPALLGQRQPVFFRRHVERDYGVSIRLEQSEYSGTTEVVVHAGRRREEGVKPGGDIGVGVVERRLVESSRPAPLTLLVVIGAYSPRASVRLTLPKSEDLSSGLSLREIEILIAVDRSDRARPDDSRNARLLLGAGHGKQDHERRPRAGKVERIVLLPGHRVPEALLMYG